jgi:hypothetical protein
MSCETQQQQQHLWSFSPHHNNKLLRLCRTASSSLCLRDTADDDDDLIELVFAKYAAKPDKPPLAPPTRHDLLALFRTHQLQLHTKLCSLGIQCRQQSCQQIHTFSELIQPFTQPVVRDFYSHAFRAPLSTRPLKLSRNCKKCNRQNSIVVQSLSYCHNQSLEQYLKPPEVHVKCTACNQCIVLAVYTPIFK